MARPAVLTVADTIAKSFLRAAETRGDRPAIREKKFGIWQPTSWREWLEISKEIAYALRASGFLPGDVASVIANAVPEWVHADMGILCAGGVSSGIYPTDASSQVEYLVNDSRTKVIFAEDEEQLDKVLACRARCPSLQKIIVFDMEGLRGFSDDMVMSLDEFRALGRNHMVGREALWQEMIDSRSADDLVILVYTSGTTGPPKGAMHANRSVTHQMRHANDFISAREDEDRLIFLPLCHVAERVAGYYISVALGSVMNFAESPETVPDNLREVQPTVFFAVPRIWEKFYSAITIALKDATPLQQWVYRRAIKVGYGMVDCRIEGRAPPLSLRIANGIAYRLAFRNIRRMMGLDRCRIAFTGAAPIAPELIRWYLALGIDMHEVYGQTENCGVATMMPAERIKFGSVGTAVSWGEVALSPDGEILIKGDFLFMGYLNQPEKTAETIDHRGWLHTGDVGTIDNEGFVRITDRMKDIIITSGGKNVTPSEIENQLKFSPYISDAVVIGDKRPYLTCLVMIDQENVEKFAQDHDIPFTNYASLCRAAEIQDLIWREIEGVNGNFARVETIKRFYLIERQLTPEDEELTPTMKLKRGFVNKRYAAEIEAMYRQRAVA
ncbi:MULTISPECIES: AMP-dependent synthetase/ligase [Bradyrhizobium]|uniref:AMP-dependent synthetase/ligase n=1 Tax=Bradyrhizobium TaxID=374 RepID=UPI0002FB9E8D|nr:AMP-dependent synthetase/ligase [Bradyrhizobium japonicum]AJA67189.1 fatty-acid--CoA ligase [Bradyrhizobium japonicum]KMJ93767.1 fatty-acid--CoA ligase [Bradyrhizobium japonicum]MCS3536722.1 long-chain acyl-CoA synthetase [Bradyrhizobium japonicum]MCS3987221.1 long-chain acyl-CoA synthetase [Bradyrhizobium japonicum]MCS4017963.1 long-chain acyl-CoA synthetase [Bradyrhizobium japonicum]